MGYAAQAKPQRIVPLIAEHHVATTSARLARQKPVAHRIVAVIVEIWCVTAPRIHRTAQATVAPIAEITSAMGAKISQRVRRIAAHSVEMETATVARLP